ncbi:MAG: ABC transporter ATP-binding protein/permease [Hyphomicrobiales bacterium]|nr:ABC transporter ATP-binding protein/permease [Hyphomicrobiales bacterium]
MSAFLETFAIIWRLAHPYFFSEDRRAARLLLGSAIAIELSLVAINVLINRWQNRFYNALQDRAWDAFINELMFFTLLAGAYVVLAVYQLYLQQWLLIRWRTWMTRRYLDRWLGKATHYRMQLKGEAADNPDQRIADDIRLFADKALFIGIRVLGASVSLVSFVIVLWVLSAQAPLQLFGHDISIPGYLVWAALIYAAIGTAVTHWVGRPLINLNFQQQRYEADFRFHLVRVRENSEQIALLKGETAEADRLAHRFSFVIANWREIMSRLKRLTLLTASYRQISVVFPYIVVSPVYFAGKVQLGGLMQTASAFESVREALSVFIDVYRELAEWRAGIARLDGFDAAIAQAEAAHATRPIVSVHPHGDATAIAVNDLKVHLPDGEPLLTAGSLEIAPGDRVLVTGASGTGKSTLFRAMAGLWPFGSGAILLPAGARVMVMPQQPYFPVATLAAAISYPEAPETFDTAQLAEALTAVGLPRLAERLSQEAHWNRILSQGEQQRLGIARALLQKPDFLFLDECTSSLDEAAEATLYTLLKTRLPSTTVISIGHRSSLAHFHDRHLEFTRDADGQKLQEKAAVTA